MATAVARVGGFFTTLPAWVRTRSTLAWTSPRTTRLYPSAIFLRASDLLCSRGARLELSPAEVLADVG